MTQDKFSVVTGGTRGIGRAVSLELARQGQHVIALYGRDRKSADELSQLAQSENLRITCLRGDLTHPEKFKAVVDEIRALAQHVDHIIHCAASGVHKKSMELTLKHLNWTFDINVFAI